MAQRIDGHVDLRMPPALPTVMAGRLAALGRGAQRSTSEASRRYQRCVCWYTAAQRGRSFGIHRHGAPVFTI
jgi:hypothetical protein